MTDEGLKYWAVRLEQAGKNFGRRQFEVSLFQTGEQAVAHFLASVTKQDSIGYGGSRTLIELGLLERLHGGGFTLLNRDRPGIPPDEKARIEREIFSADIFLASSNAATADGELVNIDLRGNRTGAISFGPKRVVLFIGRNKLVENLSAGISRARNTAAVMNAIRFGRNTPCVKSGVCYDCSSPERICGTLSIVNWSAVKGRIHLMLINEDLGF